jgi:hypothetical protein
MPTLILGPRYRNAAAPVSRLLPDAVCLSTPCTSDCDLCVRGDVTPGVTPSLALSPFCGAVEPEVPAEADCCCLLLLLLPPLRPANGATMLELCCPAPLCSMLPMRESSGVREAARLPLLPLLATWPMLRAAPRRSAAGEVACGVAEARTGSQSG